MSRVCIPSMFELLEIRSIWYTFRTVIGNIEINHILHHKAQWQSQCFDQIRLVLTFIINGRVCDINNLMSLARTKDLSCSISTITNPLLQNKTTMRKKLILFLVWFQLQYSGFWFFRLISIFLSKLSQYVSVYIYVVLQRVVLFEGI